jgi:branched-chain amino acid transport system permease protein
MIRQSSKSRTYTMILVAAVLLVGLFTLPWFLKPYHQKLAVEAIILSVFALSLDLVMGHAGIATFGHAAFFGIGGYTLGVMMRFLVPSVWLALAMAGLTSSALAFIIGTVSIRTRGIYFAILTLAFAEVVYRIIFHSYNTPLGGSDGLVGIPVPNLNLGFVTINLKNTVSFYYFALAFACLSYLTCKLIVKSPFGRVLQGIRENEKRVAFLGFNVKRVKVTAFVIAGTLAGFSGGMFSLFKTYADTEQLSFLLSGKVIVMGLIGGIGTLIGPMFGAVFITIFESVISTHFKAHNIIIGALFVIVVIFLPKGLFGLFSMRPKRSGVKDVF